jgi:hypothetical protein
VDEITNLGRGGGTHKGGKGVNEGNMIRTWGKTRKAFQQNSWTHKNSWSGSGIWRKNKTNISLKKILQEN